MLSGVGTLLPAETETEGGPARSKVSSSAGPALRRCSASSIGATGSVRPLNQDR